MAQDLTQGSIGKTLFVFSLPIVLGMFLSSFFNLVDTFFVGMLGPIELAAISISFPLFFVFYAISGGLDIGTNALISQAIGSKDYHTANNFAGHSIFLAIILGVLFSIGSVFLAGPIFIALGADEATLPLALQYAIPIFLAVTFTFLWSVTDAILRAQGNSKTPLKNLAIAVLLNIILDPLLIFGIGPFPRMGIIGAAIVTVFADLIAALLNFQYILSGKSKVTLCLQDFRPQLDCIKETIKVGLPTTISQSLSSVGFMALMFFVAKFGSIAIAAYGIGMRINALAVLPIYGIEIAVASIVGQNIGAGNEKRAKEAVLFGSKVSLLLTGLFSLLIFLFAGQIMAVFSSDQSIIEIGKGYLSILPFAYLIYGYYFILDGAFEGVGKTNFSLLTNTFYWIVAVFFAFLLSNSFGLKGIWIAVVIAAAVEATVVSALFFSGAWLKKKK